MSVYCPDCKHTVSVSRVPVNVLSSVSKGVHEPPAWESHSCFYMDIVGPFTDVLRGSEVGPKSSGFEPSR